MKKHRSHSTTAAAILAGGVLFTGPASAALIFFEGFESEGGSFNAFGMPTYGYAANYTLPNTLTPSGDFRFAFGGSGASNTFNGGTYSLLFFGITAGQIDAGLIGYDFYAQFSGYLDQNDYAQVAVQFADAANGPLGTPVVLGSQAFVAGLPRGNNGTLANADAWGDVTLTGQVPALARSLTVSVLEFRNAGVVIDGYVDNIRLQINPVPEAGTATLSGLAGLMLLRRRRA